MIAFGVDRTRGGWVVVTISDGRFVGCEVVPTAATIPGGGVVAVDIPMWHPRPGERRRSEVEARRRLGRRASTVFLTPPEDDLAHGWDHARSRGVSKQMWNLLPAIVDVAEHRADHWIEVHPELAFLGLAGDPLPPKKTWDGQRLRWSLLAGAGVEVPDDLGPAGGVPPDDILDAAVCALVASRHPRATIPVGDGDDVIWTIERGTERPVR